MDDKALLKLLVTGIGEEAAAAQMNVSVKKIQACIQAYIEAGILGCNGERMVIDWKAFGHWKKQRAAHAAEAV